MFFKKRSELNQKALDKARDEILAKGINYFLKLPDYGTGEIVYNDEIYSYGFWKYKIDEQIYHYVMQIDQKAFVGFWYKFLSGIKVENNSNLSRMDSKELSQYD